MKKTFSASIVVELDDGDRYTEIEDVLEDLEYRGLDVSSSYRSSLGSIVIFLDMRESAKEGVK